MESIGRTLFLQHICHQISIEFNILFSILQIYCPSYFEEWWHYIQFWKKLNLEKKFRSENIFRNSEKFLIRNFSRTWKKFSRLRKNFPIRKFFFRVENFFHTKISFLCENFFKHDRNLRQIRNKILKLSRIRWNGNFQNKK